MQRDCLWSFFLFLAKLWKTLRENKAHGVSWLLKNLIIIILLEIIRGSYNRHLPSILFNLHFIWAITILEPAEFSSFRFLPWIWILKQRQYLKFSRVLDFPFVCLTSNNDNFFYCHTQFWNFFIFSLFFIILVWFFATWRRWSVAK